MIGYATADIRPGDWVHTRNLGFGKGEQFVASVTQAAMAGPAWPRTLMIWLYDEHGPQAAFHGSELDLAKPLRIAVLGRPNAGKSTLINHILGQDRLLTGPEPGITRDSIGLDAEWRGRKLKIFDTAGLRRRSRVVGKVEKLAVADALRAVRFAEVVVLLLDATIPFERQDLTLADLVEQEGRALVIGLNKWDLIDNKSDKARELRAEADRLLPQLRGTRVIPVSGLTGAHVDKLMEAIVATDAIWNTRISTGRLNRWLAPASVPIREET